MIRRLLLGLVALAFLAGCGNGAETTAATPSPGGRSAAEGKVTIVGIAAEIAASARLIVLAEEVSGVGLVVLDADAIVLAPEGDEVSLAEVVPGQGFTAIGLVASDSLVADQIQLHYSDEPASPEESGGGSVGSLMIALDEPVDGQVVASPLAVRGSVSEVIASRKVRVRVYDGQGRQIGEFAIVVAGQLGQEGSFSGHVRFDAPNRGGGTVEAACVGSDDAVTVRTLVRVGFDGNPSIVLSGVIGAFYSDPPLIVLEEPVHGFGSIAVTGETRLVFLSGGPAEPGDILPGKTVWASGFSGDTGTLVAHEVVLIEEGVAPAAGEAHTIGLESPADGATVESPIELRGQVGATPFEGTLVARLWDASGELITEHPFIVEGEMGEPASFVTHVDYEVWEDGAARLEVVEISPRDGSLVSSAEIDVQLVAAPELVIVARVMTVFASARIIDLGEAVEGYELVALVDSTVILSGDGDDTGLEQIEPGATIEVKGRPGMAGTLVATEIRVLP